MINYKDLMIGNWVYESERSKFLMRVVNIGEDYCYLDFPGNEGDVFEVKDNDMMPIEVTEELLLKNGFVKSDLEGCKDSYFIKLKNGFAEIDKNSNSIDRIWNCQIDNDRRESIGGFDFQYLHELQNGIRLITKSDLGIKEL